MLVPTNTLCYVVSSEMTVLAFLKEHIHAAAAAGYDVTVVANSGNHDFLLQAGLQCKFHRVEIVRHISFWRDARGLFELYRLFRSTQFDIVHSISPKAGLLAMLAARLANIPHCIHTFTGQVWITRSGLERFWLKNLDRLLASLTTHALIDSPSQRDFLINEGLISGKKSEVLARGSICGVDDTRFKPNEEKRNALRTVLGISDATLLLLFIGRLNFDKGVLDLAAAFNKVVENFQDVRLLFVGPDEKDMVDQIQVICAQTISRVHFVKYTLSPENYMAAADILCLPSYREGFGMVIIEAAAVGIPSVASRIYGVTDAVVDGLTGLLHPPGDVDAIVQQLYVLLSKPKCRLDMGIRSRQYALRYFSQKDISKKLISFYEALVVLKPHSIIR